MTRITQLEIRAKRGEKVEGRGLECRDEDLDVMG